MASGQLALKEKPQRGKKVAALKDI